MDPADLRAFAHRDWARVREHKRRVWSAIRANRGQGIGVEVAESLRLEVLRRHGEHALDASRAEDFTRHVQLGAALRSVSVT